MFHAHLNRHPTSLEELNSVYKTLARENHPDRHGQQGEEKMKILNLEMNSYRTLFTDEFCTLRRYLEQRREQTLASCWDLISTTGEMGNYAPGSCEAFYLRHVFRYDCAIYACTNPGFAVDVARRAHLAAFFAGISHIDVKLFGKYSLQQIVDSLIAIGWNDVFKTLSLEQLAHVKRHEKFEDELCDFIGAVTASVPLEPFLGPPSYVVALEQLHTLFTSVAMRPEGTFSASDFFRNLYSLEMSDVVQIDKRANSAVASLSHCFKAKGINIERGSFISFELAMNLLYKSRDTPTALAAVTEVMRNNLAPTPETVAALVNQLKKISDGHYDLHILFCILNYNQNLPQDQQRMAAYLAEIKEWRARDIQCVVPTGKGIKKRKCANRVVYLKDKCSRHAMLERLGQTE